MKDIDLDKLDDFMIDLVEDSSEKFTYRREDEIYKAGKIAACQEVMKYLANSTKG